jgi:hypothetical protein
MPNRLRKRCGYRGCPNTTTERYCAEHLRLIRRESDRCRGSTQSAATTATGNA